MCALKSPSKLIHFVANCTFFVAQSYVLENINYVLV